MNKIEELKAAYAASTQGEWINNDDRAPNLATVGTGERGWLGLAQMFGDTDDEANANAKFITLAHNLMPQLLEAVELLKELRNSLSQYDDGEWYLHDGTEPRLDYIDEVLEKLK